MIKYIRQLRQTTGCADIFGCIREDVFGRDQHWNQQTKESRWPSSLWVGLIQFVEGLSRTKRQREAESEDFCLGPWADAPGSQPFRLKLETIPLALQLTGLQNTHWQAFLGFQLQKAGSGTSQPSQSHEPIQQSSLTHRFTFYRFSYL